MSRGADWVGRGRARSLLARVAAGVFVAAAAGGSATPGCVLPDYAPDGRPCPCIAGYRCDVVTQTCVPDAGTGGNAAATSAAQTSASSSVATTAASTSMASASSTSTGGLGGLVFADEFDEDTGAWTDVGNGTWALLAGEKWQQAADAPYAFTFVSGADIPSDFEVISRMRMIGGENGGAMEIAFRTDPSGNGNQYFCNWEPTSKTVPPDAVQAGEMLIMVGELDVSTSVLAEKQIEFTGSDDYDPRMPITMHVRVEGNLLRCWIEEIPGAELSAVDARYPAGTAGLKTYAMSTAYDFFHVYALP